MFSNTPGLDLMLSSKCYAILRLFVTPRVMVAIRPSSMKTFVTSKTAPFATGLQKLVSRAFRFAGARNLSKDVAFSAFS